jgi:hypothetical protein
MTSPFAQPGAGGDKFEPAVYSGKLLLIYPHKYITDIPTKFGEADAIECDIVILDQPSPNGQPHRLNSAMIFQNFIVGQTKGSVGGMVLGRLGQKPTDKGNPAWYLLDHTPADAQAATAYIAAHPAVSQPSQTQSAPVPVPVRNDPWGIAEAVPAASTTNGWPQGTQGAAAAIDPNLVAFLTSKGVTLPPGADQATAEMIAKTFGA